VAVVGEAQVEADKVEAAVDPNFLKNAFVYRQ